MSTVLIVVIVVVAVIVVGALLFAMTRGRRIAAERRRQRVLESRREQAVTEHREAAEARSGRADEAEHRARVATAMADRERAEARLHEETARSHEMGLADDDLMRDDSGETGRRERIVKDRDDERVDERDQVAADSPRQNSDR
jgi:biopolymer transport protein ExbB/TolQ